MRITTIETLPVGAGWKNWVFVHVRTDTGIDGWGEGTLNGFARTITAAVDELAGLVIDEDPRRVSRIGDRLLRNVSNDGGHIHRTAVAAIETACWDILGKSLGAGIHELLGGRVRDRVTAYANGWYRVERTPEDFVRASDRVVAAGLRNLKLDPFGTARGFIGDAELARSVSIVAALRDHLGHDAGILIDAHARFTVAEARRVARALEPYNPYWLEEPAGRELTRSAPDVAAGTRIRVATGETFHTVGEFFDLAQCGNVGIWQPEPMSLGGIGPTMQVAHLAAAADAWIAPHQSGGPIATAVCLQLAGCVGNFLVQEHFDPFNEPWTADLVSWTPTIDHQTGTLDIPTGPGLGVEVDEDVARAHPYDPNAHLDVYRSGWERRLGQSGTRTVRAAP